MENTISLSLGTIIDIVILAMLCATVFYALRLSGQLKLLRQSKSELEHLVSNLAVNINRAHEAISEMQNVAETSGNDLHETVQRARGLSSELQLILEAGDNLADRLGRLAQESTSGRRFETPAKPVEAAPQAKPAPTPKPAAKAEEKPELLRRENESEFAETLAKIKQDVEAAERDMGFDMDESDYDLQDFADDEYDDFDGIDEEGRERVAGTSASSQPPSSGFVIRDPDFEDFPRAQYMDDDNDEDDDFDGRIDQEFEALTSRAERELASALKRRRRYDA
ncbi:MAG: hypothetical protein CMH25_03510 [Micavibrio sp.]|nr:hypothetical protein [Micavibrio sp.]|tara:strand:+ start:689526 stop:690368 length:843 start_codon:yes stop_codon:yes gene_type:complete